MQPGQADFAPAGYTEYTYSAAKKGYSGTACWCREQPLSVTTGIGIEQHDHEEMCIRDRILAAGAQTFQLLGHSLGQRLLPFQHFPDLGQDVYKRQAKTEEAV